MEDGRIDEGRKLRLAARHLLRLVADARPDRVYLVQRVGGSRLLLSHDHISRTCLPILAQLTWQWTICAKSASKPVPRYRTSHELRLVLMRTSESKFHSQLYDSIEF